MAIKWDAEHAFTTNFATSEKTPRPTYDGAVLGIRSQSCRFFYDDYGTETVADVWDGEKVATVSLSSNFPSHSGDAVVDATPAAREAAAAWYAAQEAKRLREENERRINEAVAAAKSAARGKELEVVRGRKVKVGTVARCFWAGSTKFGDSVGLELADGSRVFTSANNVEVAQPDEWYEEPELLSDAYIAAEAARLASARLAQLRVA